jgi:hypothetical protein
LYQKKSVAIRVAEIVIGVGDQGVKRQENAKGQDQETKRKDHDQGRKNEGYYFVCLFCEIC